MSLPVVWTSPTRAQLTDLYDYILQDNPRAAAGQLELIIDGASSLAEFPEMGRPGRRSGTRELVVPGTPYIVVYRIKMASIEVLAVMHGARRWPRSFS